ncbi:DUF2062 domain-containing protein [Aquimarina sp. 2201CG14-23]|uniref:DUF2062 domain-containing protein n=1 Tax=Aquimarina mycalae TaxID=3040073 RepID=UPI002477DC89|nr:DUF2062 domain-containing protein [Aquimarina sp. 2201CG14-23]MDH7446729.1 DUF2062 domain-containing protein [Aquimarina sp. 2201CG14-23]
MTINTLQDHRFETLNCCVFIPTYNNQKTLDNVIKGVLEYTDRIIVVNDGATDDTSNILAKYKDTLRIITFPVNKGKGVALREGFKEADRLGYDYMITIDSDGQHFPNDLPVFLDQLEKQDPNTSLLLIGSRNMDDPSVPGKSSFGNKFSNFWYYIETGIKLKDTQSGYRLYPIKEISKLKLFTSKFELEIEVIVKLAWRNVEVRNIPVQVLYDETERVSHFRPFKDFTRISILNTWLVTLTLFYYLPKRLIRRVKKKGFKKYWRENVLRSDDPPFKKASAISLGLFIGISPLWGFHTILALSLAVALKLNRAITFLFSNISLPPFIPFIIYCSYQLGAIAMGKQMDATLNIEDIKSGTDVFKSLGQYILGSFILATLVSLISGVIAYLYFSLRKSKSSAIDA